MRPEDTQMASGRGEEPETPAERLKRLINDRTSVLHGTWGWHNSRARIIATREIVREEMHDMEGAGMATAGPRLIAVVELLLDVA